MVKSKGVGEQLVEGSTTTGAIQVVESDAGTLAALRASRTARGLLALDLVGDAALVLSNLDGTYRHPERLSRRYTTEVARARKASGEDQLPRSHVACPPRAVRHHSAAAPVTVRSRPVARLQRLARRG